jgi:hypothetical protein
MVLAMMRLAARPFVRARFGTLLFAVFAHPAQAQPRIHGSWK